MEAPPANSYVPTYGIQPDLAVLETLVYPPSTQIQADNTLAQAGTIEVAPMEAPLTLFVWSAVRILPVRLTDFSITEEAFDQALNPIRAKVSLGMRVLSVNDLSFDHKGNSVFLANLARKEMLAGKTGRGSLSSLGISQLL